MQSNRRNDAQTPETSGLQKNFSEFPGDGELTEGIVVPPGCDNPMLHAVGEPVHTYTPSSYRPVSAERILPHSMSGKTGVIAVPQTHIPSAAQSMTGYLSRFKGAYICLDLWSNASAKVKKCGILTEIGENFLVIRDSGSGVLSLIDLKPIRYINIYCK